MAETGAEKVDFGTRENRNFESHFWPYSVVKQCDTNEQRSQEAEEEGVLEEFGLLLPAKGALEHGK